MDSAFHRRRARESRAAIERLYIGMRHLFIRGSYKPQGVSGEAMREALLTLSPEIYGSVSDPERVELDGLLYVVERLPRGIEECRFIKLIAREGYEQASFDVIVPAKRRRNCFRIDADTMYIELTRGRSDIYDVLTHLTFLFIEADKIRRNAFDAKGKETCDWKRLSEIVEFNRQGEPFDEERATTYLSNLLGRTYEETRRARQRFAAGSRRNDLFHVVYWLGRRALEESRDDADREILVSPKLREIVGHHTYGEHWAEKLKAFLLQKELWERPLHIVSANLHSVMNALYGHAALELDPSETTIEALALETGNASGAGRQATIRAYAAEHGLHEIADTSGTNITVQIIDTDQLDWGRVSLDLYGEVEAPENPPVLLVMDYAFGEQAYECLDELLKPYEVGDQTYLLNVASISILGKAGILEGDKGDIIIPTAHVFEGTADNYPLDNGFTRRDFEGHGVNVVEGPMVTVLGTSLQNRDVLYYFLTSSWNAVGLEMEGAHYQKAIQAASRIRGSIRPDVRVRYAYYASDNPLVSGKTLASGSLGAEGVKPTYLITAKVLQAILRSTETVEA